MQPNYDIRIFEKYAELLDRHLEANEELRLFFENHPEKKNDYVLKMIDSGPIEDFFPESIEQMSYTPFLVSSLCLRTIR